MTDDFPPPKSRELPPSQTFNPDDPIIVTTACEESALQQLTGKVVMRSSSGSYIVRIDVDDSTLTFLPHEIGHRY